MPTHSSRSVKAAPGHAVDDPKLKKLWQSAFGRFAAAKAGETEGWDVLYESLDDILHHDPPLYLAGGYKSEKAFLQDHMKGVAASTIRDGIRVARHFDPADERVHGTAKLGVLLDYLQAKAGSSSLPEKLDPSRVRIEIKDGTTTRKVAFASLSYDQLRAAARAAKGQASKPSKTDSAEVKKVRAALQAAGLRQVGLRATGTRLTLSGVEVKQLVALGKALAKLKV